MLAEYVDACANAAATALLARRLSVPFLALVSEHITQTVCDSGSAHASDPTDPVWPKEAAESKSPRSQDGFPDRIELPLLDVDQPSPQALPGRCEFWSEIIARKVGGLQRPRPPSSIACSSVAMSTAVL